MIKIVCVAAGVLLLGAPFSRATDFSEDFPDDATPVSFDLAAWCDVAGHRFYFEKTPLAEVIRALGAAKMQRTGDAGAAIYDYYVDYTDGRHLIRFSSNSDMGGDEHALQGVEIRDLSAQDRARLLPRIPSLIRFPFGSSDMTFPALMQKLGRTIEHHGIFAYTYSTKYKAHDTNGRSWMVDAYAYLRVSVQKGVIDAVDVSRTSESE